MRQVIRVFKTPVTLIILLALVAVGGWWGLKNATAAIPPRPPEPCVKVDVGGKLTPNYVTVRTLNAGLRGGLAKRVSTQMRAVGYYILKVNNSDQKFAETVVIGNSKDDPEVKLVAGFFKNAKTQGDGRIDHVVDVLLGDDYAGKAAKPLTSIAVTGPVCLPALPASEATATASPAAMPSTSPSPTPSPTKS